MQFPHTVILLAFLIACPLFAITVYLLIRSSWNRSAGREAPELIPRLTRSDRAAALSRAARALRMDFEERPSFELVEQLQDFVIFSQGMRRILYNRLVGAARDCRVEVFDYAYDFGPVDGRGGFNSPVVLLQADHVDFPRFDLRPTITSFEEHWPGDPPLGINKLYGAARRIDESFFGTIPSRTQGLARVSFPVSDTFSESYSVHATEPQQVKEFFSEDVVSYFDSRAGIHIEARAGRMIYWRGDGVLDGDPERWLGSPNIPVSDVRDLIREALAAFRLLTEPTLTSQKFSK